MISQVGPKYREDSSGLPWLYQDTVDTDRLIVESVGIPGFALIPGVTINRGTTETLISHTHTEYTYLIRGGK